MSDVVQQGVEIVLVGDACGRAGLGGERVATQGDESLLRSLVVGAHVVLRQFGTGLQQQQHITLKQQRARALPEQTFLRPFGNTTKQHSHIRIELP
jgi:hypothetical protein